MRISKRQLKRIIREEYSKLKRRGLLREMAGGRLRVGTKIGKNHIGPSAAEFPGLHTIGELMHGNSVDGTGFYIAQDDEGNYYLPDQYGDEPFGDEIEDILYSMVPSRKKKKKLKKKGKKAMRGRSSMRAPMDLGRHYVAPADPDDAQEAMELAMEFGIPSPQVVGQVGGYGSTYVILTDGMGKYYLPLTATEDDDLSVQELIEMLDDAKSEGDL